MDDPDVTTETSVFVCSPVPQDPECEPTTTVSPTVTEGTSTTLVVGVPPTVAPQQPTLPHTGFEGSLAFLGAGLVAVGLACLRRARLHLHTNTRMGAHT